MQLNAVPAREINRALKAAEVKGTMPSFTEAELLTALRLHDDEADGLTLMERFTGESRWIVVGMTRIILDIPFLVARVDKLLYSVNRHTANPAQEALASMLGSAVTRQILREEEICPSARNIVLTCKRDDIISPEVKAQLPPDVED